VTADHASLLEVQGLSKAFGGVHAVDDLSFTVWEGEILGLLGPNGSGKTTVFNLIAGAIRPDNGQIHFSGRSITRDSPSSRSALGIARTFQLVRTFPNLCVLDNVLIARLHGRDRSPFMAGARTEAAKLLRLVALQHKGNLPAAKLTLAERKRLEIVRALAAQPRLLLLDEPVAGLNPPEVGDALALFKQIRTDGVTVVIVEHNVGAVRTLCDRVIVLNSGKKIAEGPPADALETPEVMQVYLGKSYRKR
jgi:branched-chain amino acid transport system ATP-binding protein